MARTLSPAQQVARSGAAFVKWRAHPTKSDVAVSNIGGVVLFPRIGDRDKFLRGARKLRRVEMEEGV